MRIDENTVFDELVVKEVNGPRTVFGNMSLNYVLDICREELQVAVEEVSILDENEDLQPIWNYKEGSLI